MCRPMYFNAVVGIRPWALILDLVGCYISLTCLNSFTPFWIYSKVSTLSWHFNRDHPHLIIILT